MSIDYQSVSREMRSATRQSHFPGIKSHVTMLGLLLLAIATAVGQHFYYAYLDRRQVSQVALSQEWVIRAGTALAYLFKTFLVVAVSIAFCHGFWYIVRRHALRIGS